VELSKQHHLFVGFKLDTSLRRQLEGLTGPDRRYLSSDDSTFLRMCRLGDAVYVGKVIEDGLTTGSIEDVKRNVLSIMRRLCPEERFPSDLAVMVALPDGAASARDS